MKGLEMLTFQVFLEAVFKDSAYILEGILPKEKFKKRGKSSNKNTDAGRK